MKSNNLYCSIIIVTLVFQLITSLDFVVTAADTDEKVTQIKKLCDDRDSAVIGPVNKDVCACQTKSRKPWGEIYQEIDCRNRAWSQDNFAAEILPVGTEVVDLSFNNFRYVPDFIGKRLKNLKMNHNNITAIDEHNFIKVFNLVTLDLSWNSIEQVSMNAFAQLSSLQELNLSRNRLKYLQPNIFSPLVSLIHLILSENPLNKTFDQADVDLIVTLGVTPRLEKLEMDYCNLNMINIRQGVGLNRVSFRFNNFLTLPDVPREIEILDFSGNPIKILTAKFLPHLYKLHTLYLEDMPNLTEIKEYALFGLPRLHYLNLQGSKNLSYFSEHAFGTNVILNETDTVMEKLNMRGTNLRFMNSSLRFAFENIRVFDLSGNPFFCDCEVIWIKELNVETGAKCDRPNLMRGKLVSDISTEQLVCRERTWLFRAMTVLLILLLIVLCAVATYLIMMGIKPSRRQHLQKLGASSPYARITTSTVVIDPNRAENAYN